MKYRVAAFPDITAVLIKEWQFQTGHCFLSQRIICTSQCFDLDCHLLLVLTLLLDLVPQLCRIAANFQLHILVIGTGPDLIHTFRDLQFLFLILPRLFRISGIQNGCHKHAGCIIACNTDPVKDLPGIIDFLTGRIHGDHRSCPHMLKILDAAIDRIYRDAFRQFAGRIVVGIQLCFFQCIQTSFGFRINGSNRCAEAVKGISFRIHPCIKDFCVRGFSLCDLIHPSIQGLVCLLDILDTLVQLLLCRHNLCSQVGLCILHTSSHTVFSLRQAGIYFVFRAGQFFIDTSFRFRKFRADISGCLGQMLFCLCDLLAVQTVQAPIPLIGQSRTFRHRKIGNIAVSTFRVQHDL